MWNSIFSSVLYTLFSISYALYSLERLFSRYIHLICKRNILIPLVHANSVRPVSQRVLSCSNLAGKNVDLIYEHKVIILV